MVNNVLFDLQNDIYFRRSLRTKSNSITTPKESVCFITGKKIRHHPAGNPEIRLTEMEIY